MTPREMVLDLKATHAARRQYARASERWSEDAIRRVRLGDPCAKAAAALSNWTRRRGNEETE